MPAASNYHNFGGCANVHGLSIFNTGGSPKYNVGTNVNDFFGTTTLVVDTWYHGAYTRNTGGVYLGGRVAAFKAWTAVLSLAEIQQEMWFQRPIRTANLLAWHPMLSTIDDEIDFSGNGRTMTVSGTQAVGEGPPIAWGPGRQRRRRLAAAGGGSLYTQLERNIRGVGRGILVGAR
jgi:hypothetical protein